MLEYREGIVYLVIEPGRYNRELRVVRATQKVPASVPGNAVVLRVNIRLPRTAFLPTPLNLLVDDEELIQQGELEALPVNPEGVPADA